MPTTSKWFLHFILLSLLLNSTMKANPSIIYPDEDGMVRHDITNDKYITTGVEEQWWPWITYWDGGLPKQEDQVIFEYNLSSYNGLSFLDARMGFYIKNAEAFDSLRLEVWYCNGNGLVDTGDFDSGTIQVGSFNWDSPSPGTQSNPINQFLQFDVTSALNARNGDNVSFNIRLAGDHPEFDDNIFNSTNYIHFVEIAALENGTPSFRPYLEVIAKGKGPSEPAGKSNFAHLYLYEKDPATWEIVGGGAWGKMKYNLSGPEFDFVFNGHELEPGEDYTLIYYPDPWPGTDLIQLGSDIANEEGHVHIAESVNTGDLPAEDDQNYSDGAKIWLILSSDCDEENMTGWNPTEYLFEYDLITFDDTDE